MQADQLQRKTPAVRLVSEIIHIAMAKHASDIHIEPRARRRLCGSAWTVCCVTFSPSRGTCQTSLISRNQNSIRYGHHGAPDSPGWPVYGFRWAAADRPSSLFSSDPVRGENSDSTLETKCAAESFADLGIPDDVAESLTDLLSLPQGMLLVTGPTAPARARLSTVRFTNCASQRSISSLLRTS